MNLLTRSLPIVAKIIGDSYEVRVAIGGQEAKTDGKTIFIPTLPENDEEAAIYARGFLDHESAHVRFTDFNELTPVGEIEGRLRNTLEDIRSERRMYDRYPGVRHNRDILLRLLVKKKEIKPLSEDDPPVWIFLRTILFRLYADILQQPFAIPLALRGDELMRNIFPAEFLTKLQGLLGEAWNMGSTKDASDLAKKILALIQEECEEQQPQSDSGDPPEEQSGDSKDQGAEGSGSDSDESSDGDPSEGQGSDKGNSDKDDDSKNQGPEGSGSDSDNSGDGDPSEGQGSDKGNSDKDDDSKNQGPEGSGSDSNDSSDGDPSEGQGTDKGNSGKGDDSKDQGSKGSGSESCGSNGAGATGSPEKRENLKKILKANPQNIPGDLEAIVAAKLEKLSQDVSPGHFSIVIPADGKPGEIRCGEIPDLGEVHRETAMLRTRLFGLVQATRQKKMHSRKSGKKIDERRLFKLAYNDPRIFTKKREQKDINTAILILLDKSSSMNKKGRIDIAKNAVLASAIALESLPGVVVATAAFPLFRTDNPNGVYPLTNFGEQVRLNHKKFGIGASGGTPLTEALWWSGAKILARPEPRKIILTVSDGEPHHGPRVVDTVKRLEREGIEMLGLGIEHAGISTYFPVWSSIQKIQDLPAAIFKMLQERLAA